MNGWCKWEASLADADTLDDAIVRVRVPDRVDGADRGALCRPPKTFSQRSLSFWPWFGRHCVVPLINPIKEPAGRKMRSRRVASPSRFRPTQLSSAITHTVRLGCRVNARRPFRFRAALQPRGR